jgi:hypothetical protein
VIDEPLLLRRLDRHGAGRIVRRIARQAGITRKVGPHTLRHAFITVALEPGVPLRDVQEAASHADLRTTMRYDNSRVLRQAGEKPQVTRSRWYRNSGPRLQPPGRLTRNFSGAIPSDTGSGRQTVEAIGGSSSGASRTGQDCGSRTPTVGRGIRTVPIPDSASTGQDLADRHATYIAAAYVAGERTRREAGARGWIAPG